MNSDKNLVIKSVKTEKVKWYNPLESEKIKLYGLNWLEDNKNYNRLPNSETNRLKEVCPNVLRLAKNTAGVQAHFYTNSKNIVIDVLVDSAENLSTMTAVARAGFDLYVGKTFKDLQFFGATSFNPTEKSYKYSFLNYYEEKVLCVLNFPLYTGVDKLMIGIDESAVIEPSETFLDNPRIICYGTSITQGGCASRPGLNYTNILTRKMSVEWLNYGFSGNAFGEGELIEVLAKIDNASLFIIDYEANSGTNGLLKKTLRNMISIIRNYQPKLKIMVISRIPYLFDEINQSMNTVRTDLREFQRNLIKELKTKGDSELYFVDGSKLLGENYHDYTVDNVHPNDLGFMKFSESIDEIIKLIMKTGDEDE